jgi:hypothetical protein
MNETQKAIQETKKALDDLYKTQGKGFSDIDKAKEYEKTMQGLKKELAAVTEEEKKLIDANKEVKNTTNDVTESNEKVEKSGVKLTSIMGKVTAVLAAVGAAAALAAKVLSSTEGTLNKLRIAVASAKGAWDGFLRTIASGDWENLIKNINNTAKAEKELKEATIALTDLQASNTLKKSFIERSLQQNKLAAAEAKTDTERKKYLLLAIEDQKKLTDVIVSETNQRVSKTEEYFVNLLKDRDIDTNDAINRIKKIAGEYNYWFGENSVAIEGIRKQKDELTKKGKESGLTDDEKKIHKELRLTIEAYDTLVLLKDDLTKPGTFNEYIKSLAEANNAISSGDAALRYLERSLTGIDKRDMSDWEKWWDEWFKIEQEAIENGIKLNEKLKKEGKDALIESLPIVASIKMQKEEALKELEKLKTEIIKNLGAITPEQEKYFSIIAKNIDRTFQEALNKETNPDILGTYLKKGLNKLQKDVIPQKVEDNLSFWKLLGLDPDSKEDQKMINALEKSADKVQQIFSDILVQRVEFAQRERELLDTRISETQRELELEASLMQEGYANNLTARKAYLEQLKTERDKALKEEEKAIRQQQTVEKLLQTMNLLTSVTEILKSATKKGLVGLAIAPFAIATLFAIWSKAKSSTTMLAEGGSGTVTGRRHSEGGERFLDHVEIEQGERWGVLSRKASGKYGEMFHDMVSSFNKDQMPEFITPTTTNLVRVDNNGPNSRLDRVIKEQEKMNTQLKQGQLYTVGSKRIIKSGNKTRIIG